MIESVIRWSIKNRIFVVLLSLHYFSREPG